MAVDNFIFPFEHIYILTFIYIGLCSLSIAIGREGGVAPLIALARSEAEVIYFLDIQCLFMSCLFDQRQTTHDNAEK